MQKISGVHISDVTALYRQIIEKILLEESIPNGTQGYYFALAHDIQWWETLDRLAITLNSRELVDDTEVKTWSSKEAAAEALGLPVQYVHVLSSPG